MEPKGLGIHFGVFLKSSPQFLALVNASAASAALSINLSQTSAFIPESNNTWCPLKDPAPGLRCFCEDLSSLSSLEEGELLSLAAEKSVQQLTFEAPKPEGQRKQPALIWGKSCNLGLQVKYQVLIVQTQLC